MSRLDEAFAAMNRAFLAEETGGDPWDSVRALNAFSDEATLGFRRWDGTVDHVRLAAYIYRHNNIPSERWGRLGIGDTMAVLFDTLKHEDKAERQRLALDALRDVADKLDAMADVSEGLPARLRRLRNSCNMTQEELAAEASVDKSAISRYEKGRRTPQPETMRALANALGVNVTDLAGNKAPT